MQNEIREDMLKVKRMIADVEIILGKREGETELVNKLIDAQNLLTYCMSRLENAIVPPCKVGDRVYAIYTSNGKTLKSYIETYGDKITQIKINRSGYHFKCWWGYFHLSDIGKTVFLTEEEAEQALKGHEGE